MPELAEVEHYRRKWDVLKGERVESVLANTAKRVLRGVDQQAIQAALTGKTLVGSEAHGKQMLFRFGKDAWLGIHLGMAGSMRVGEPGQVPGRHEHLVLVTRRGALIFDDPRLFGRILLHAGPEAPEWWRNLPPAPHDPAFSRALLAGHLKRRGGSPLKAFLLMQDICPGVGNWMADEILWRSGLAPSRNGRSLSTDDVARLHREIIHVARRALEVIPSESADFGDPPKGWLFHVRWENGGACPKHDTPLLRATVGGRTTAWCPVCQPEK